MCVPLLALSVACIDSTAPVQLQNGGGSGGALPGSLQVNVTTTGTPDPNGYQVVLNESTSQHVGPNGTVTFGGLAPGPYQVTLFDLDGGCLVEGAGAARSFTITSNAITRVEYTVACP